MTYSTQFLYYTAVKNPHMTPEARKIGDIWTEMNAHNVGDATGADSILNNENHKKRRKKLSSCFHVEMYIYIYDLRNVLYIFQNLKIN